jgi:hypothetical protein
MNGAPYPPPSAIPIVDGTQWIVNPADRPNATGWIWTVIGGDCDNVLPHPTFAVYKQADSTASGARVGSRATVKFDTTQNPPRYVTSTSDPLVSIRVTNGNGVAGGQIHPAFGLSGDYVVQGEFDLNGAHYVCTQKVQVRAPGIRAELCWDTVGGDGSSNGNDIDLHFARLQGVTCSAKGWDTTCSQNQDCYYSIGSGCPDGSGGPGWGYSTSADSACLGWSSKRSTSGGCTNPRLDKDNITCDPTIDDPTNAGTGFFGGSFCGPENINIDNPNDSDAFVVGVNHFGNHGGTSNAKPHVNVYCNGARVVSAGFNPVTGQTSFPLLKTSGADSTGDIWTVATVKAHVSSGQLSSCDVTTVPSHNADPTRDGANQICVDSTSNATPSPNQYNYKNHQFIDHASLQGGSNGGIPATAAGWCKH